MNKINEVRRLSISWSTPVSEWATLYFQYSHFPTPLTQWSHWLLVWQHRLCPKKQTKTKDGFPQTNMLKIFSIIGFNSSHGQPTVLHQMTLDRPLVTSGTWNEDFTHPASRPHTRWGTGSRESRSRLPPSTRSFWVPSVSIPSESRVSTVGPSDVSLQWGQDVLPNILLTILVRSTIFVNDTVLFLWKWEGFPSYCQGQRTPVTTEFIWISVLVRGCCRGYHRGSPLVPWSVPPIRFNLITPPDKWVGGPTRDPVSVLLLTE